MVGEGVLFECLDNPTVTEVLIIGRKHYDKNHPKLKELIVKDFLEINNHADLLKVYHGCFLAGQLNPVIFHLNLATTTCSVPVGTPL